MLKENIFLSIIVPIYNAEKYLERCIDSIVNQIEISSEWEVILINDGSYDNSLSICKKYESAYANIKLIDKKNEGVSLARSCGLDIASGRYVTFIDADDWIEKDFLRRIESVMLNNDLDVLAFDYYFAYENSDEKSPKQFGIEGLYNREKIIKEIFPQLIHDKYGKQYRPAIWGNVYNRKLLKNNYLCDSNAQIGEDGAITISVLFNSEKVYFLPECLYNYYLGNESVTRAPKEYNKMSPYVVNSFIEKRVDMDELDFRNQLNRKISHDVFNVCCSFFNSNNTYAEAKNKILDLLDYTYYKEAIYKCKYNSLYYNIAKYSMKNRFIYVIYLLSKVKIYLLKRMYHTRKS